MKKILLLFFFSFPSFLFILNAQPLGQYPMNVMLVDELPTDVHAKLRISANVGGVYRFTNATSSGNKQIDDFFNKMKIGLSFNADMTYFFSENLGAGAVYSYARYSHKINDFVYQESPNAWGDDFEQPFQKGKIEDQISIQFIGPAFQYRYYTNYREDALRTHLALGYVNYHEKLYSPPRTYGNNPQLLDVGGNETINSGAFGIHLGVGYDFALSEKWALGIGLSALIATRKSEQRTTEFGQTENFNDGSDSLNSIELSVGLRYNK
ncbi:MAG: hypothetical protein LBR75_03355 [Prevotellaceae bacterium]|jgi:opacity protein-like surface antigen|nr:hypothetical protein [Prevotellaceae bacterium]